MDTSDLKIFATVARCNGMNRAAAALNTVQSNVTARVRALERKIGCALFDRHSRGVALTAAGQRLLPYAEQILHLLAEAQGAAKDDGEPAGGLTLGSLESTAALRLAPVLSRFVAAYPKVDLVLRTGTTAELIEAVRARRLQGAFVCGPVDDGELEIATMFTEELVLRPPRASARSRRPSAQATRASSSSRPAVPIGSGSRVFWPNAASNRRGCSNLAPSRRSSSASAPVSASRCCRAASWRGSGRRIGSACIRYRARRRGPRRCSCAVAMPWPRARSSPFSIALVATPPARRAPCPCRRDLALVRPRQPLPTAAPARAPTPPHHGGRARGASHRA